MPRFPSKSGKPFTVASKAVSAARTAEMEIAILSGLSISDTLRIFTEKWGIEERQVWNYYNRATKNLKAEAENHRENAFAEQVMLRRQLRSELFNRRSAEGTLEHKDYDLLLKVLQDESKLLGLYAPQKVAFTDPTGQALDIIPQSDEAREQRLQELMTRASKREKSKKGK